MKKILLLALILSSFLLLAIGLSACDEECSHEAFTQTVVPPTCDQAGYTQNLCAECAFSFQSDTVPPTGHTLASELVAPTCVAEGYTRYSCTCGYAYSSDFVAPTGHSRTKTTVSPTCTEEGYDLWSCSVCSLSYRSDFTEPMGHALQETTVAPTCEGFGYVLQACDRCDFSSKQSITNPLGHDFSSEVSYPTRTEPGALTLSCACGTVLKNTLFYSDVFEGAAVANPTLLAKGIDVSEHQHTKLSNGYAPLNWTAVRNAGFDFAILKAGSTPRTVENADKGGISPVFEMNYRDAKAAGLELGVYFYTYATTIEEIRSDARLLASWLEGKQLEYPVYFDLEEPSLQALDKDTLTEFCMEFISILQENGYYGALYCNNTWLTQYLHADDLKSAFDLWYARYPRLSQDPVSPSDVNFTWNNDRYGVPVGMWQYTACGAIDGISGVSFDFNFAYRDYPAIIKKFGYNGYSPTFPE